VKLSCSIKMSLHELMKKSSVKLKVRLFLSSKPALQLKITMLCRAVYIIIIIRFVKCQNVKRLPWH